MCNDTIQFQMETRKLGVVVHIPQTTQDLVILGSCLAEHGKEMYKSL